MHRGHLERSSLDLFFRIFLIWISYRYLLIYLGVLGGFGSDGEESASNAGDLGWEDPLEKGMATHSSILACRIPWIEEPGGLQFMGLQRVRHDWGTNTFISFVSFVSPSICHEMMGLDAIIFSFWMLSFKPAFSLSSFTFVKRFFSSSDFCH